MEQRDRKQEKLRKAMKRFVIPLSPENVGRQFCKSELIQDLDFMIKTMEDVHPDLYFNFPKEKAKARLEEIKNELHDGYSRIDFFYRAARLVAHFCDGHTQVYMPNEEYFKYKDSDGLFFPFEVDCSSGKITIVRSFSKEIHPRQGAIIASINGYSAEEILDSMITLFSFKRREMTLAFISCVFRKLLFILYGASSAFSVSLGNNGDMEELNISGVSFEVINSNIDQDPGTKEDPYTFKINKEEKYVILDFRSFVDPKKFKNFVRGMFKQIESDGVKKLIIDLRKNGGGNSSLTDELVSYITDKPFRQYSRIDLKVSKLIRKYYSVMIRHLSPFPINLIPARLTFSAPWKKGIGEIVSNKVKTKKLKANKPRFTGKIIVLIGPDTFSSATDFATVIKDHNLGMIVGTPTGGFPSSYGDCFPFSLPNTCLQCGVSHKFFLRPNGDETPKPLHPDHSIENSDPNSNTDKVLEFAIRYEQGNQK